jgi:plasmid stabilization system protein ParE
MDRWLHPGFETDLVDAAAYYQAQRPQLGTDFLDEAEMAIEEVMSAPERWPAHSGDIRKFRLRRFPYSIRYRISRSGDTVQFLSVIHGSRHPDTARDRQS